MTSAAVWRVGGYRAAMVSNLKYRLALAVLVGVLVIPIISVNNGGLSHLLFCEATVAQSFALGSSQEELAEGESAPLTSSTQLSRDEPSTSFEGREELTDVCEGVSAAVSAQPLEEDRVALTVTIINDSQLPWRGSVGLQAAGQSNDADLTTALGEVEAGSSRSTTMELRILPGQTEISGTLLLGP